MEYKLPIGFCYGQGVIHLVYFVQDPKVYSKVTLDKIDIHYVVDKDGETEFFLGLSSNRNQSLFCVPIKYFEQTLLLNAGTEKMEDKYTLKLILLPFIEEEQKVEEIAPGLIVDISIKTMDLIRLLFQVEKLKNLKKQVE
ncbi:MAG: hypothetical protein QXT86_09780 [Archaeoglobaceae archaeon]